MKKILFVHIKDPTTDFLETVYEDRRDCTIVRGNLSVTLMNDLIDYHDQVVMMGHGSSSGLFGVNGQYIINYSNAEALRSKNNNIFIWCYAKAFAKQFNLPGFCTNMFISEDAEARYILGKDKYVEAPESIVESNNLFVTLVKRYLDSPIAVMSESIIREYCAENLASEYKEVIKYNNQGLTLF